LFFCARSGLVPVSVIPFFHLCHHALYPLDSSSVDQEL